MKINSYYCIVHKIEKKKNIRSIKPISPLAIFKIFFSASLSSLEVGNLTPKAPVTSLLARAGQVSGLGLYGNKDSADRLAFVFESGVPSFNDLVFTKG